MSRRARLVCRQEQVEVAEARDMAWYTGSCEATFTGPDGNAAAEQESGLYAVTARAGRTDMATSCGSHETVREVAYSEASFRRNPSNLGSDLSASALGSASR